VRGRTARDRLMTLPFSDDWCKRKGKEKMNIKGLVENKRKRQKKCGDDHFLVSAE